MATGKSVGRRNVVSSVYGGYAVTLFVMVLDIQTAGYNKLKVISKSYQGLSHFLH